MGKRAANVINGMTVQFLQLQFLACRHPLLTPHTKPHILNALHTRCNLPRCMPSPLSNVMEESSVSVDGNCYYYLSVLKEGCPSSCDSLSCDIHTADCICPLEQRALVVVMDLSSHAALFLYWWIFWMFFSARVRIVIFSGTWKWNITAEFLQSLLLWSISGSFLLGTPEISKMILIAAVYFVTLKLTHLPCRRKDCRYACMWTRIKFSFKYCPLQAINLKFFC